MTLFPLAMLLYGWSAGTPWIAPELGTFVFGAGIFMSFVCPLPFIRRFIRSHSWPAIHPACAVSPH